MSATAQSLKKWVVTRMAASHLAGLHVTDALTVCAAASRRGWTTTLGYWNDPHDTPADAARAYHAALDAILTTPLNSYLSVKVTILQYDYGCISDLLGKAAAQGVRIHFDAMDPSSAEPTFSLLERSLAAHSNLGCTLPSRWRRSLTDADRVAGLGIPVRIVKGQWADPADQRIDPRAGFISVVQHLAGSRARVAVATHDRPLARRALGILTDSSTACEMEQLSSLPQNCASVAAALGVPFRIYVPFGHPSLPYDIWQARARAGIIVWALRDFIAGRHRPLSGAA
ncbi:MAG TPA: proline dehydrogenase [Bacteroidota bacterium]|nr:proline dehydrogenase [Bacteroidota bacterium]